MYTITKDFEFCYGHRVWNQKLRESFSDDLQCACRHIHGHEAKVSVSLTAPQLTSGMVTDFRHLEFLKRFLNQYVDHQFLIDKNDPLLPTLIPQHRSLYEVYMPATELVVGRRVAVDDLEAGDAVTEMLDGMLIVDFVPTSENLSRWIAKLTQARVSSLGVQVSSVTWWETPKSRSEFRP